MTVEKAVDDRSAVPLMFEEASKKGAAKYKLNMSYIAMAPEEKPIMSLLA